MAKTSAKSAARRRPEPTETPAPVIWLTIQQVLARVPFSKRTLEDMLADGRLPYARTTPNGPRYVRPEDVEALFVVEPPRRAS